MSVQVKTPTKTQFDHSEFQCGEHCFSAPEPVRSKDDISVRSDSNKFAQPWSRKRRYSQSYRRDSYDGIARRKRLKSSDKFKPLPTRFLLGGSIDDPLNLNGLENSEIGRILNMKTPQSSPLPIPWHNKVEVRVPTNITDPLNLNDGNEDTDISKLCRKKKHRHNRHKKKDDSVNKPHVGHVGVGGHHGHRDSEKKKDLMEALKIDIEPEMIPPPIINAAPPPSVSKHRKSCDRIVSPVIRQISPKNKKRRRTNSGSKPDASSSISKALLIFPSPSSKPDKKTPPKKFYNRQFSKVNKQQQQSGSRENKKQPKFIYGNYNRYYGYRNPFTEADHRLKCFNRDWFEGKSVLDIGCNVGHLTLTIARDYHPSKIVGIDIDHKLIAAARKNIRYYMSTNATKSGKFPISNILNYGPIEAPPLTRNGQPTFPQNVLFMQGNYVLECDELLSMQKEEYDVVLALSITKWIHFNWGDDGLKRFFKRIFRQLRPGGRLILEPQPWSSYKKKKKLSDEIFANFRSIRLRPDRFSDYLLSKDVGFSTSAVIDVPFNSSKGFRRPIQLFTKPDTVASSPLPEFSYSTDAAPVYMLEKYVPAAPSARPHTQPATMDVAHGTPHTQPATMDEVPSTPHTQPAVLDLVPGIPPAATQSSSPGNLPMDIEPSTSPSVSHTLELYSAHPDLVPGSLSKPAPDVTETPPLSGTPDMSGFFSSQTPINERATSSVASHSPAMSDSSCSCSSCCSSRSTSPDRGSDVSEEAPVASTAGALVPGSVGQEEANIQAGAVQDQGGNAEDSNATRSRRIITRRRSI